MSALELKSKVEGMITEDNRISLREGQALLSSCQKATTQQIGDTVQILLDRHSTVDSALRTQRGNCSLFKIYFEKKNQSGQTEHPKREKDRKIALNSGLLGILKGYEPPQVSNTFGPGGLGTGINNMGGLRGTAMGDPKPSNIFGPGSLGTREAGEGGNSLGISGLGTHGHGRGTGGYGNIDLGGRGKGETRIVPGRIAPSQGGLPKEEIGRVIRRNLARFKYCYEKELNMNPNLAGRVAVEFDIGADGKVAKAKVQSTTMNDKKVEQCVVKVTESLTFPEPAKAKPVHVTYPFAFNSF